jgi:gliding motility-associated-like protein
MAGLLKNNLLKAVWLMGHAAFVFGTLPATAQHNLVPNGGFEIIDTCPNQVAQLEYAKPWRDIASIDLYNTCSPVWYVNVPINCMGFQHSRSGNGYAGFLPYGTLGPGQPLPAETFYHEYLQIELTEPLKQGKPYCYQYFISPTYYNFGNVVLQEFSIVLSDTPITYLFNPLIPPLYIDYPVTHTCHTGFTTDTSAWYEIKGEFQARGGEMFLTIGIFRPLSKNDFFCPFSSNYTPLGAYYYIDDVSLWYCGPDTVPKPTDLPLPEIPNVFTPNGDGYNDEFRFLKHEGWELYAIIRNRWGQVVFEGKNDHWWDGTINGQLAAPGVYYYTVTASNHFGQHETFQGVVTVLR